MKKNIPLHKSLKFKINLLVTTLFLVIIFFFIYVSNQNQKEMIATKENDLEQIAIDTIERRFTVSSQILETSLAQITASPLIVETMANEDADELAQLVSKSYKKLQEVGVDEFHFHLPNNRPLLNLYLANENDSISPSERQIIQTIHSDPEHLPIQGVEECEHGLFLRYIEPIYQENEYIGSVELGMKISSRILNIFKDVSGGEWSLYTFDENGQSLLESTIPEEDYSSEINKELALHLINGQIMKNEKTPYLTQKIPIASYDGEYRHYFKRVYDNSELIALQSKYTNQYLLYGLLTAIIMISLLWALLSYLLNPLLYLEQKVRLFEAGALTDVIEVKSTDEIGYLARAMENMREAIYKREVKLKRQRAIDPLTGVCNRFSFDKYLDQITEKKLFPASLIVADIDELKEINDERGHLAGDKHIINAASIINQIIDEHCRLFRIGGDEFMIILPETSEADAEKILEQIIEELDNYNTSLKKGEPILSISFGLGICDGKEDCLEAAIHHADKEMYKNKAMKKAEDL